MRQKIAGGKLSLSRTQKRRTQALVVRLLLIAGLLILWEFMVRSGRLSSFYTSYPSEIAADLWEFYTSGDLYKCCFANKLRKIFIQSAKKKRRLKGF